MSLSRFKKGIRSYRNDDYVSVWFGKFKSKTELEKYLKENYEGGPISKFAEEFKINYYDHDFLEVKFLKDKGEVSELIEPLSYSKNFIGSCLQDIVELNLQESNAAILLYNFCYDLEEVPSDTMVRFVNFYKYR